MVFPGRVLYSPAELLAPGFDAADASLAWALSGFSNSTVWLIFGAVTIALGYEKTGLGRRIAPLLVRAMGRRTLTLGYAIVATDTLLAPFTPSSTARTAGTVYPVIRHLPPLYGSMANDPSSRLVGSYLMWTALATGAVTNSMFLTGMAPNLLAVEIVNKTVGIDITWTEWFLAFVPLGVLLLLLLPWLVYRLYPAAIKGSSEVAAWANYQLQSMGPTTAREALLASLVALALFMWVFGGSRVNPTTTALAVVALMLLTRIVSWEDILLNKQGWTILVWFATLIALADGLNRTGVVSWFASSVTGGAAGVPTTLSMLVLVSAYFFSHYFFASVTAHTTAMLPIVVGLSFLPAN